MIGRDCRCPGCGTCAAASEVERLRAEVERLRAEEIGADEHQMYFGIRLDRYKTIADSWRAKVAEVEAERDEARAEVERLRDLIRRSPPRW